MAAPGESFPQQFALGVLQLSTSLKKQQAELAEMRQARAARNFLEEEKLEIEKRRQEFNQEKALRDEAFAKAQAEAEQKRAEAQLQLDTKRVELLEKSSDEKSMKDLDENGIAVVRPEIVGSVRQRSTDEAPIEVHRNRDGSYTAIRVGEGANAAMKERKLRMQELSDKVALQKKDIEYRQAQIEWKKESTARLGEGLSGTSIEKAVPLYDTLNKRKNARIKAASEAAIALSADPQSPEAREIRAKIALYASDPRNALDDEREITLPDGTVTTERKLYDDIERYSFGATAAAMKGGVVDASGQGAPIKGSTPQETEAADIQDSEALQSVGLGHLAGLQPLDVALQGDTPLPETLEYLPSNYSVGEAKFHIDKLNGFVIPLTPEAFAMAEAAQNPTPEVRRSLLKNAAFLLSNQGRVRLHPAWRKFRPGSAPSSKQTPPSAAPAEEPAPVAQPSRLERITNLVDQMEAEASKPKHERDAALLYTLSEELKRLESQQ